MVLGDDFDGKMPVEDFDIGMCLYGFDKALLYFGAGVVLMVQDAELGVATFLVQVEVSLFVFVKFHSPVYQFLDLSGSFAHHFLYGSAVTDPVARNHSIFDVLVEIINQRIGY